MVDSPQGPAGLPEKTESDQFLLWLENGPPMALPTIKLGLGCLPVFLVCCGILASAVLFFSWAGSAINDKPFTRFYFVGLVFVGPLLFGIAGILHRLNQGKRD